MFSFRKKEKDKKKEKEKKEQKKKEKGKEQSVLTEDELNKLDEVKKGLFRRHSEKETTKLFKRSGSYNVPKSESIDEGMAGPSQLPTSTDASSADSMVTIKKINSFSTPRPTVPPPLRPKPKSILKGTSNYGSGVPSLKVTGDIDDSTTLQRNTKLNESQSSLVNANSETAVPPSSTIPNSSAKTQEHPKMTSPPEETPGPVPLSPAEKTFDFDLHLPSIIPPRPGRIRTLTLRRQPGGDFGFSLRKGVIMQRTNTDCFGSKQTVIFAEPGTGPKATETGLLPGDRLIEVNDKNVEKAKREEIIELIRTSSDTVVLKVQPVPELLELSVRTAADGVKIEVQADVVKGGTLKRSGSVRYKKTFSKQYDEILTKSEEDVKTEKAWLESDKIWLIHKGGFSGATLLKTNGMSPLPDGKVKVKMDHGGEVIEVDEEDIEKSNPPQFDKTEDLTMLRYLNESSLLHVIRQRYGSTLVHSYSGPTMIVVNPMVPLSIYSEKVIQMFKGCKQEDMPPHIYSVAQHAHREMLSSRLDQSIVLIGRSGSGKTTNAHHILQYFVLASGSVNNFITIDKVNSMDVLLETFGNSRTILNTNASRFSKLTTLDFDFSGQVSGITIQIIMLEKSRLVRRPEGEPTFHIFYQMLAGVDSVLRNELQLTTLNEQNTYMTPLQRTEDRQKAAQSWAKVTNAMEVLGFSPDEMKAVFYVLAAIYHLETAGAVKGTNNKAQFAKPAAAQKAANLLGIKVEELARTIFSPSAGSSGTLTRSASMRISNAADRHTGGESGSSATDALEAFLTGLYTELFSVLVGLINRSLMSNYRNLGSITILDTPGFQNPSTCGRNSGATFEDLCCNYIQERLQLFFHDATFTLQQDRYSQENIECDFEFVNTSPAALVFLIDKPPQQTLLRASNQDLRDADKKGLLWLLDDEAIFPGATEDSFMERLFTHHGDHPVKRDSLLRKGSLGHTFILNHFQGTNPVQYNATGWLKACRENSVSKIAIHILQDSNRNNISDLFTTIRGAISTTVSSSSIGAEKPTSSLRRAASMRRTLTSSGANLKRKSICLQVKLQVDSIIETLRRTKCHFVHCVLPQNNAGLCELKGAPANTTESNLLNVPLVRSQIRGAEILEAVRIFRLGFPDFLQFSEFKHRFEVLMPLGLKTDGMDERQIIKHYLDHMDIDKLNYRIGLSQVFFRAGSLTSLEVARDEKITGTITKFQACCRGYLGRKKLEKLRLQQTAISCIQKNVRKFMLIRDWPWWRLYVRVKPLLNVHKTEEELKNKEAELEQLKVKFEKVEREKNEYKLHCDRLDSRLSELNADLAEEATTTSHASEMLEQETAERMRLEKELKDVQGKYNQTRRQNEKLEREVMQCRLWQATSFDGDAEEDTADESVYKERYEKSRKELHFLKQQLQHQHEEELQQEQNIKRHLEKRYQETTEEKETLRQQVCSQKKKCTKLNAEMQDIKRHLDEQTSRNNDLERKQRRFDSELNMSQQECREERSLREKLLREKEELQALKYSMEQANSKLKMDNELSNEKIERLERELADLSESGGKDDKEYMALKRAKHELSMKVAEQEEELDDQAGQIQQLEQTKLRLEMNLQNLRQQHIKEIEEKDDDLEELRYSTQKKLKQLESQLEEEYDDKRLLMQDKRELERQVQEMMTQGVQNNSDNERKLKKDLRRTKALLRDAEIVIQKQQSTESSKATIRQLRNQLEDAAFTAASAVKAKKNLEIELEELQQQLEEMSKGKQDAETRYMTVLRELTDVQSRTEEAEEDMNEIMAKYKAAVRQQALDQMTISEHLRHNDELQAENEKLKSEISSLTTKVESNEDQTVSKTQVSRLESKVREVESKLELETSTRHRLESNLARMKEQLEKVMEERDRVAELRHQSEEKQKKLQRQIRDIREETGELQKRELETNHKKQELESRLTDLEIDYDQSQSDLKLAFKRISGLQAALEESVETDEDDESYLSYSDEEDFEDDLDDTFLSNHKPVSSVYDSSNERSRSISGTSYEQDAQFGAETLTFNKGSVSEA
ncbi:unconventional myosin-XVIIIa isoform X3 [Octopus sinensis]|uniref:Unconventional myosin-XVIIIa isoform X3 n=1 Tax=Octopus sinensis TaxID=2607531 RepID=A0A7E6FQ68_9MOLL|nr:unconventional myosin-XVIIIa isoform X3 [Octopus sinensis]